LLLVIFIFESLRIQDSKKKSEIEMIKTTGDFTNTITYNIFSRFKIQSSLSLLPVCIQIFIQLQFDSNFFSVSFLISEIFIELRKISTVLLHSYKTVDIFLNSIKISEIRKLTEKKFESNWSWIKIWMQTGSRLKEDWILNLEKILYVIVFVKSPVVFIISISLFFLESCILSDSKIKMTRSKSYISSSSYLVT
jgi:hypothetical protein